MISLILFLVLSGGAVTDVRTGLVPNRLVFSGAALLCLAAPSDPAFAGYFAGVSQPGRYLLIVLILAVRFLGSLILIFPVFRLRLFGAGDLKITALLPAFLGVREGGMCVFCALFPAAAWSFWKMFRRGMFRARLEYFLSWLSLAAGDMSAGRMVRAYRGRGRGEETFPFVPFLLAGFLLRQGWLSGT